MSSKASRPGRDEAILVFRIGSLGDTVVALPALHEIRRRHLDARIVLLTNTPADGGVLAASSVQVLAGTGLIDDVLEYPHGRRSVRALLGLLLQLRYRGIRRGYFLMPVRSAQQDRRDRLFFRLAGIRHLVGVGVQPSRVAPKVPGGRWEGEARRLMRTIGAEGRSLRVEDFCLHLGEAERNVAAQRLSQAGLEGPYLVIGVGGKRPANDWGDDNWREVLRQISGLVPGHGLVAIGAAAESGRHGALLAGWPGGTANLCGALAPRESAAILERARLMICRDSGPMHLASAVRTPTVAVFSARDLPGLWFPFAQEDNVIYRDVPCKGCELYECTEYGLRCMTGILPKEVVAKAAVLLGVAPLAT
jgi:ADP-heptose:LPS heptosyltransferase